MSTITMNIDEFVANNLNAEQKKAVTIKNGVLLVVAGAGSGKTRVITARIAHLIANEQVAPESILALTFTNKAAKEMRERIQQFLGRQTQMPFIGTFHSYCLKLLKQYGNLLETPFMGIMDEDDQQKLLTSIIHRHNLTKRTTAKKLSYQISQLKNSSIDPDNNLNGLEWSSGFMRDVYHAYEREKRASHCLDFDDLLLEIVKLFKKNKLFKQQFQDRIRHVLVDEYQDTNIVQHALLKECVLNAQNQFSADSLCVVGDEDQSIYSWRGATIANIVYFKKDFPQTVTIKIEQNYRSVQPILKAANEVIQNNTERNPKNLWSTREGSDRILVAACLSEYQEGEIIAQFVKASQQNITSQIAILYRAHYQSRAIEEAFIKHSIPYTIIGGIEFYERKEIKDLLAYLRLVVNPFDRISFSRVINCPPRGLGEKFEEEFYVRWGAEPFLDFKQVIQGMIQENALPRAKKAALITFATIFESVASHDRPTSALEKILSLSGYMTYLKNSYETQEAETRMDNVKELLHAIKYLEDQGISSIALFLDEVTLMQDKLARSEHQENPVILMTLHAAKGLEFDHVVVAGLEEGILPSSRSINSSEALEEERRLLYVGITRAKERLLLTTCRYRYIYGQMSSQYESRFLEEIPAILIARHDASSLSAVEAQRLFSRWMGTTSPTPRQKSPVLTFGGAHKVTTDSYGTEDSSEFADQASPFEEHEYTVPAQEKIEVSWKKHQPVLHKTFGTGIIQVVEKKEDGSVYLTIAFRMGIKKIDAKFVSAV